MGALVANLEIDNVGYWMRSLKRQFKSTHTLRVHPTRSKIHRLHRSYLDTTAQEATIEKKRFFNFLEKDVHDAHEEGY